MGIGQEQRPHMTRRALLTDREKEVLRGEADDIENPAQYRSKIKTRVKSRLGLLIEDYELLQREAPELANRIHDDICDSREDRLDRLEREVDELRGRLRRQE